MPDMVKIAAIAVAAALCSVVVKKNVAELGMVLALCAGAIILSCSLGALEGVKELMDTLAESCTEAEYQRLEEIFVNCSRYELGFWEMAWTLER